MRTSLSVALLALSLASCGTVYRASTGEETSGYREIKLENGLYAVEYIGDPSMTTEHVQSALLYRCAEIARAAGAAQFAVLESKLDTSHRPSQIFSGPLPSAQRAATNGVASPQELASEPASSSVTDGTERNRPRSGMGEWRDHRATAIIELLPQPGKSGQQLFETSVILSRLEPVVKKKVLL